MIYVSWGFGSNNELQRQIWKGVHTCTNVVKVCCEATKINMEGKNQDSGLSFYDLNLS